MPSNLQETNSPPSVFPLRYAFKTAMLLVPGNGFVEDDFDAKLHEGKFELQQYLYYPIWFQNDEPYLHVMYVIMKKLCLSVDEPSSGTACTTCIAQKLCNEQPAQVSNDMCVVSVLAGATTFTLTTNPTIANKRTVKAWHARWWPPPCIHGYTPLPVDFNQIHNEAQQSCIHHPTRITCLKVPSRCRLASYRLLSSVRTMSDFRKIGNPLLKH